MLQHSRATYCSITLRADRTAIRLTVRNNGAEEGGPTAPTPGRRGTGLTGLGGRVMALGGESTAGAEGGTFTPDGHGAVSEAIAPCP